jgi:hypothetical protein
MSGPWRGVVDELPIATMMPGINVSLKTVIYNKFI